MPSTIAPPPPPFASPTPRFPANNQQQFRDPNLLIDPEQSLVNNGLGPALALPLAGTTLAPRARPTPLAVANQGFGNPTIADRPLHNLQPVNSLQPTDSPLLFNVGLLVTPAPQPSAFGGTVAPGNGLSNLAESILNSPSGPPRRPSPSRPQLIAIPPGTAIPSLRGINFNTGPVQPTRVAQIPREPVRLIPPTGNDAFPFVSSTAPPFLEETLSQLPPPTGLSNLPPVRM